MALTDLPDDCLKPNCWWGQEFFRFCFGRAGRLGSSGKNTTNARLERNSYCPAGCTRTTPCGACLRRITLLGVCRIQQRV